MCLHSGPVRFDVFAIAREFSRSVIEDDVEQHNFLTFCNRMNSSCAPKIDPLGCAPTPPKSFLVKIMFTSIFMTMDCTEYKVTTME